MNNPFLGQASATEIVRALSFVIAFLLGSIPFGLIVSRIFNVKDLTKQGSGNIGATNVTRVLGLWPAGFITFLLDALKGFLAVMIVTPMGNHFFVTLFTRGQSVEDFTPSQTATWFAGFLAILGHCYSPWLHFKGGKGVATALGVMMFLSPISGLFGILGFALTFLNKRIASLASIAGLILASIVYLISNPMEPQIWVGAAMIYLILIRHEENINALLENREKPFGSF